MILVFHAAEWPYPKAYPQAIHKCRGSIGIGLRPKRLSVPPFRCPGKNVALRERTGGDLVRTTMDALSKLARFMVITFITRHGAQIAFPTRTLHIEPVTDA